MHVHCPYCQTPVEVVPGTLLAHLSCLSCGSSFNFMGDETVAHQAPQVKTIGHFELVDQIGTGSFGSVWKARDRDLDRTVAVKIPRKGQLDAAETEQFLREARAAAQLHHPNIVSVHEVGRDADTIYMVSDYIEGLTLDEWLSEQSMAPRKAVELCAKAADALHHAHEAGVIHRDLKPSNIILDAQGEPHVMDFGLAKREAGEVTMTVEGKILGTPAYMSPEQAKGEAHSADRRSDVYSLGVILFELLTREKPFRGNARLLLHQVIHNDAPSPRKFNRDVPRDLETICLKCLEKDPGRRYSTAQQLAEELRRFLRDEPIHARPVTTAVRIWRWSRRTPAGATLAVLLLVLMVVGPPVAIKLASRSSDARESRPKAEHEAASAVFQVGASPLHRHLRITEIMFDVSDPAEGDPFTAEDFQFVELQNTGAETLDLSRVRISGGIEFFFGRSAVTSVDAGQFVLVVKNEAAFASRYDTTDMLIAGEFRGRLDDGGGRLCLEVEGGEAILDFQYYDSWYSITEGAGFSLHVLDVNRSRQQWDGPKNWRPSREWGGSPGGADAFGLPDPRSVVVNEVMPKTGQQLGDWIELYNTTDLPIDISGWFLSDDIDEPRKYQILAGTTIQPRGVLVFNERDHFGSSINLSSGFGLSSAGEAVVLTAGQLGGGLLGYQEVQTFGAVEAEVSLGRYHNSTGHMQFVAMSRSTMGAANASPKVGPVVINEIMYNPASGDKADEFIELYNVTGQPVPLFDPARPEHTWRFTDGIEFSFLPGAEIPSGGFALVVQMDPEQLRSRYPVPASVPIFGPYTKALANEGERVALSMPFFPNGGSSVSYKLVDQVEYDDKAPWPEMADGHGPSLERIVPTDYGNDAVNWMRSTTNGSPGFANMGHDRTPPSVPTNLNVTLVRDGRFDLTWLPSTDEQSGLASYNIYRDSVKIGTSLTASFIDVSVLNTAIICSYQVSAVNRDGVESALSEPRTAIVNDSLSLHGRDPARGKPGADGSPLSSQDRSNARQEKEKAR